MEELKMIEFFSGIGGMRFAVEQVIGSPQCKYGTVHCCAFDISLHANRTYEENFGDKKVATKLVEHLKSKSLDGKADLWTMSPPCQPFTSTRGAKGLDTDDKRCNGLKGIMKLLTEIEQKPKWILLENVKGFAESRMVEKWKECLEQNGFSWKDFLLSPIHIGIPNHRLRYFILCEHSDRWKTDNISGSESPPSTTLDDDTDSCVRKVGEYIDTNLSDDEQSKYIIPDSILERDWASQLGIVSAGDNATHCFTAGYGRIFHRSTGSLLLTRSEDDGTSVASKPIDRSDMLQYSGKLRRFTPKELLSIFGFPNDFSFPANLTLEHEYKLVGNSVNVTLVAKLLKILLTSREPKNSHESLLVGGEKGHIEESIEGNMLKLYQSYRWKMIPQCTGRHTCRDHAIVSGLAPLEMLANVGISCLNETHEELAVSSFRLPGRADEVLVVPLDSKNETGVITFAKQNGMGYVHTLNTPSGFRRKLDAIGIEVTDTEIRLAYTGS